MMMTSILLLYSLTLFYFFNHPLPLVITLIFQTLVVIMAMYSHMETPWVSFITFLIYLGGLLIIFIYLSALVPNEFISLNMYTLVIFMSPLMVILLSEQKENKISSEIMNNLSYNYSLSSMSFFLFYIMMILCILMFLCNLLKTPLKQENY